MTEEIIIDGVNVAGCRHYDKTLKDYNVFNCYENCDLPVYCKKKDCYYKQLKRLEQENKELRDGKFRELDRALEAEDKYKSALEEINRALLGVRGLSINCDKQIIKVKAIINEVLGC